jgi:hypothetical protein
MALQPTTKLEAINTLLTSIGEAPVQQEGSGLDEEAIASAVIDEVSRATQLIGWSWNTEDGFPLSRDGAGQIFLPSNALKVDFQTNQYIARGIRVYDRSRHTYTFTKDLTATVIFGLDWTELSEAVRSYVMYRAGRTFQARQVSAQILHEFTKIDEERAWVVLASAEEEVGNRSLFHNQEIALMLNRDASISPVDYLAGTLGGTIYD